MPEHRIDRALRDFDEQLRVFNHLKAVMEEDGHNEHNEPYYKYKPGWNDRKVGDKFRYDAGQILRFRQKRGFILNPRNYAIDNLSPWRAKIEEAATKLEKLDALEKEIERLKTVVGEHAKAITGLEEAATKPKEQPKPQWQKLSDVR